MPLVTFSTNVNTPAQKSKDHDFQVDKWWRWVRTFFFFFHSPPVFMKITHEITSCHNQKQPITNTTFQNTPWYSGDETLITNRFSTQYVPGAATNEISSILESVSHVLISQTIPLSIKSHLFLTKQEKRNNIGKQMKKKKPVPGGVSTLYFLSRFSKKKLSMSKPLASQNKYRSPLNNGMQLLSWFCTEPEQKKPATQNLGWRELTSKSDWRTEENRLTAGH